MAQTKTEIQSILAAANASPKHRFGQNFMIDGNLVRLIADEASLSPSDVVIEVGPGTGTLTGELLSRGVRVVAVEIDRDLAAALRERFADASFELIEGDALANKHTLRAELLDRLRSAKSADASTVKLVANLPYNIASPLVIELLIAGADLLVFTVQKEVAQRLRATTVDELYGPLSIVARLLSDVELLRTLPPQAFWPAPKIDSAVVRMKRNDCLGEHASAFSRFVHDVFAYRRKTLRKALDLAGCDSANILATTGIDGTLRPEAFEPADWLRMFHAQNESRTK